VPFTASGGFLVLVVGSVLADELLGTIIKVDADAKVLVVVPKDSDQEIKVKVTDKTALVTRNRTQKLDLGKLAKKSESAVESSHYAGQSAATVSQGRV